MKTVAFFDLKVNKKTSQVQHIGCTTTDVAIPYNVSLPNFIQFINDSNLIYGRNIFRHNLFYIQQAGNYSFVFNNSTYTHFLSPLLFLSYPYHHIMKDEKVQAEELNNPVNDSKKVKGLFSDEVAVFGRLEDESFKIIYFNLLHQQKEFSYFSSYINYSIPISNYELQRFVWTRFENKTFQNASHGNPTAKSLVALGNYLVLFSFTNRYSIMPHWVLHTFPGEDMVKFWLQDNSYGTGCKYRYKVLNPGNALKRIFGYPSFRSKIVKLLRENAFHASIYNKHLWAVFLANERGFYISGSFKYLLYN